MTQRLIECVPNISEGRDAQKIKEIAESVKEVEGIKLLDVDPGKTTNRTVITFVGEPEQVVEAAFRLIKRASELIDMSKHSGEHPRMGATDVCPMIPISGISMDETVKYAHQLGERVGKELGIPGYFYEHAAKTEERRNLANNRAGEYEGLADKITTDQWKPDFGPAEFNKAKQSGATNIGVRDFLVAYNVNLNTTSTRRANAIAFDIRERGRIKREGNPLTGEVVKDENGDPVHIPGSLKSVKGIGWFIEEYGVAQLSLNLTNISITPVHIAFDEACKKAGERGIRVTGSELVGLIPLKAMLDAGRYFLQKQNRSLGVPDSELIKIAVKSMGLDELTPFNPNEKIIEYVLKNDDEKLLVDLNLTEFANETSSESPAPGGGSISAYVGALGVSLGTMVANLSSHKRGWDDRWEEFSEYAVKGQEFKDKLLHLVDEDTRSFNKVLDAFRMSQNTEEEKELRKEMIEKATHYATEVPLEAVRTAQASMSVMKDMVEKGLNSSLSDAIVGALCARTAAEGAFWNVKINAKDLKNRDEAEKMLKEGQDLIEKARNIEAEIIKIANEKF